MMPDAGAAQATDLYAERKIDSRPTVLVAEDDELVRAVTVENLRDAGYEILDAANGREALAVLETFLIDVLITDIGLPGAIDGWKIAETFRSRYAHQPVIYISGLPTTRERQVPNSIFVEKPFQPARVLRLLHDLTPAGHA
jgi:CheY-like chemotaxis protein